METWVIPKGNLRRRKRHSASNHEEDKKRKARSWVAFCDELITLGPSVPGVPGRPRGPCRPWGPAPPLSPGKPRSPCKDTTEGGTNANHQLSHLTDMSYIKCHHLQLSSLSQVLLAALGLCMDYDYLGVQSPPMHLCFSFNLYNLFIKCFTEFILPFIFNAYYQLSASSVL